MSASAVFSRNRELFAALAARLATGIGVNATVEEDGVGQFADLFGIAALRDFPLLDIAERVAELAMTRGEAGFAGGLKLREFPVALDLVTRWWLQALRDAGEGVLDDGEEGGLGPLAAPGRPVDAWTHEQRAQLRRATADKSVARWDGVAALVDGRDAAECRAGFHALRAQHRERKARRALGSLGSWSGDTCDAFFAAVLRHAADLRHAHTLVAAAWDLLPAQLSALASKLPGLRSLSLVAPLQLDDFGALSALTDLRMLAITDAEQRVRALPPGLTALRALNLDHAYVDDFHMRAVAGYTSLEFLSMAGSMVGDDGIAKLGALRRLRVLWLPNCRDIGDKGAAAIAANHRELHTLSLRWARRVTHRGASRLAGLPRLRTLWLGLTDCGSAAACAALARCAPLRSLDVRGCPDFDDASMQELAGATQLRQLSIPGCLSPSDLVVTLASQLEHFDMGVSMSEAVCGPLCELLMARPRLSLEYELSHLADDEAERCRVALLDAMLKGPRQAAAEAQRRRVERRWALVLARAPVLPGGALRVVCSFV